MPTFLQACQTPPIAAPPASGQTRSLVWQCHPPTIRDTPGWCRLGRAVPPELLMPSEAPSTHLPIREGLPYHPDGNSVVLVVRVLADASPPVRRSGAVVAFCCGNFWATATPISFHADSWPSRCISFLLLAPTTTSRIDHPRCCSSPRYSFR